MTFSPVIPLGGYAGWKFLNRTIEAQKAAFSGDVATKRDAAYFREKIGSVTSAEQLVGDRRLLSVALGAFGLSEDIGNKYFIRKVLEDGTLDPKALSNKLSDKRYSEMSRAFGFGDYATPSTQLSDFADKILAKYETRQFEVAVGTQNDSMRLALNAQRELGVLAAKTSSEDTKWFSIMGSAPLRSVVQTALGLPDSFASIDLDQQLGVYKDRAERYFGSSDPAQFTDPAKVEELVKLYLLRADSTTSISATAKNATALTLLQSSGTASAANILSLLT